MKKILFTGILCLLSNVVSAQARLTIENNSQRQMTVKVMRGINKGRLHKKVQIPPYGEEIIYFSKSGQYFCKTKAVYMGKRPICRKGKPFRVVNENTGYSVIKLIFSIRETKVPQITGGETISESEFDQD